MTQFYTYRDAFGTSGVFSVGLGNDVIRFGELNGLTEMAQHLQAGTCSVTFDDPTATLGYGGDAFRANAQLTVTETGCPSGNRRLYTGIFGTRKYRRGASADTDSLRLGVQREIDVEMHDLNTLMSFRVIPNNDRTAIRPAESVTARMAWLMGTSYTDTVVDRGYVVANSTVMTKADYRGQRPANVVGDCEMSAGFGWNAFVYWNEATSEPALFFDNANTSTAFSSTLRLSNVLADLDSFTDPAAVTFAPADDAELTRDPSDLGSGVYLPFLNNAVYRTLATTITAYGRKDISAPNSNVTTRARANAQADDFLYQHATEDERITCSVELPTTHVNLLRAGQRVQVKFSHLPGYESFTWMRVVMRSPGQKLTDDRYTVKLELSPQEATTASTTCHALSRTATGNYYPLGGSGSGPNASDGVTQYWRPGLTNPTYSPAGVVGSWTFGEWGAGGAGTIDYAGDAVNNALLFCVIGDGTAVIKTETYSGSTRTLGAYWATGTDSTAVLGGGTFVGYVVTGNSISVTVTGASTSDETCVRWIKLVQTDGLSGGKFGWSQMAWTRGGPIDG